MLADESDGSPRSGPLTRSQLRASQSKGNSPPKHSRHTSRHSLHSVTMQSPCSSPPTSPLTPAPESSTEEMTDAAEDSPVEDSRMTRSGKAFGVWQSRRRRLRQEAIDDPDMEADEDEVEEDDEEGEEEGPGMSILPTNSKSG